MSGPALPVAGHTEWLAFLDLPPTEQCAPYEPHRQHMIDILDRLHADTLSDEGAYPRPPAGVCVVCNGAWFCKCLVGNKYVVGIFL